MDRPDTPAVIVPLERIDRASLAALDYARSLSADVTAVHVATDERASRLIRDRWRRHRDGITLDALDGDGAFSDRVARYLDEHALGSEARPVVVVLPAVAARPRWLFPLLNWTWSRIARRLARRPWTAVATVPVRV